jgi:hypothetical protein
MSEVSRVSVTHGIDFKTGRTGIMNISVSLESSEKKAEDLIMQVAALTEKKWDELEGLGKTLNVANVVDEDEEEKKEEPKKEEKVTETKASDDDDDDEDEDEDEDEDDDDERGASPAPLASAAPPAAAREEAASGDAIAYTSAVCNRRQAHTRTAHG